MSDPQKMILYRKRQDLLFQVLGLACMLLGILVLVIEAAGRLGGVNFDKLSRHGQVDPRADYPLCFREPDEPFGEVYFKRAGPLEWTGRPLSKILELRHGTDPAYRDDPSCGWMMHDSVLKALRKLRNTYDEPYLVDQIPRAVGELQRIGAPVTLLTLPDHSHADVVVRFDGGDDQLAAPLAEFVQRVTR